MLPTEKQPLGYEDERRAEVEKDSPSLSAALLQPAWDLMEFPRELHELVEKALL